MAQTDDHTLTARLVAEFIGTFALVFFGTGAIVANQVTDGALGHLGVAIAFGLVIGVMVYTFKSISGAQFNPAVSVALWARNVNSAVDTIRYVAVQILAAITASLAVGLFADAFGVSDLGATLPVNGLLGLSLLVEIAATFTLVTVILGVVRAGEAGDSWAGVAIGGTVALAAIAFGPISGASLNPARSVGPAFVQAGATPVLWIYILGPLGGGLLAALVDRAVTQGVRS